MTSVLAEEAPAPAGVPARAPRIWLLLGDKKGDNAQVEIVAEALGWPVVQKHLAMRAPWVVGKPRVTPSLHHIDPASSDPLAPPWPDLILTAGRRPSMAALWVRAQSGGRTRLVLVGKPSGMFRHFDLVIAAAPAQLPALPNVLALDMPLVRLDHAAIDAACALWRPRLDPLPRPLIVIAVGGPTRPFVFDRRVTERLLALAHDVVAQGGTPYVTTSRRTPLALVDTLARRLPAGARLFAWRPDAEGNPYLGLLGLADGFVVTGDSITMMVEVVGMARPLAILEPSWGRFGALERRRREAIRLLFGAGRPPGVAPLRTRLARLAERLGVLAYTRDFRAFHRMLIDRGLAVRAGEPLRPPRAIPSDALPLVVARVRALVDPAGGSTAGQA